MKFSPLWLLYVTIPFLSSCDITNEDLLEHGQITGSTVIPNTVAASKTSLILVVKDSVDTTSTILDSVPVDTDTLSLNPDSVFLYSMDNLQKVIRRVPIQPDGSFIFFDLSMGGYSIRSCNDSLGFEYHNIQLSDEEPGYDVGRIIFSTVTLKHIEIDTLVGVHFFSFEKPLITEVDGSVLYPSLVQKLDSKEHYYQVVTVQLEDGTYQDYMVTSSGVNLTITDLPVRTVVDESLSSSSEEDTSYPQVEDPVDLESSGQLLSSSSSTVSSSSESGIVIRYSFSNPD
ncbi:MAG: hypothetical protein OCD01_16040 [Fibrobacterales bacterium]